MALADELTNFEASVKQHLTTSITQKDGKTRLWGIIYKLQSLLQSVNTSIPVIPVSSVITKVISEDKTIEAQSSYYVSDYIEILDGISVDVLDDATLEIG